MIIGAIRRSVRKSQKSYRYTKRTFFFYLLLCCYYCNRYTNNSKTFLYRYLKHSWEKPPKPCTQLFNTLNDFLRLEYPKFVKGNHALAESEVNVKKQTSMPHLPRRATPACIRQQNKTLTEKFWDTVCPLEANGPSFRLSVFSRPTSRNLIFNMTLLS